MITVTRLQGEHIVINASMIEFIETTPDTLISLSTGRKLMVRESVEAVIELVKAYYQAIGLVVAQLPRSTDATNDNDA
jgi:flagellar protein FlbD